jgi:hypothetical protein
VPPELIVVGLDVQQQGGVGFVSRETIVCNFSTMDAASATSGLDTLATSPSSTIALDPAPTSSAGWNRATYVPAHVQDAVNL